MRLEVRAKEYYERLSRFEKGEPKKQAVECRNDEEWEFVKKQLNSKFIDIYTTEGRNTCIDISTKKCCDEIYYKSKGYQILQFPDYIKQENLQREWEDYILPIAKEKYPKGTRVNSLTPGDEGVTAIIEFDEIDENGQIWFDGDDFCALVYDLNSGKYAEIIQPLFTTEDNVKIYEGDDTCLVNKIALNTGGYMSENVGSFPDKYWYFSNPKAAKEFVKKEKERREKKVELIKFLEWFTGDRNDRISNDKEVIINAYFRESKSRD